MIALTIFLLLIIGTMLLALGSATKENFDHLNARLDTLERLLRDREKEEK